MPLPDDKSYGKLFWLVVGTTISGVMGTLIIFLTNRLTPKPYLEITVPPRTHLIFDVNGDGKTWAPWQAATYINIKNTATLTPAKSVTIGIDIGDKRAFDVQGDLRCKVLVVNSSEDKSFSCDLINPGTQLTFSVQGVGTYGSVVDPQLISVQVDYDGYSSNNNFDIADCPTTDAFKMLATVRIANTCYQKAQNS